MVWAWRKVKKVLFKFWKKVWHPKPNPEAYCWKKKEVTYHNEKSNNKIFYETLFKQYFSKTNFEKEDFHNSLRTKTLTNEQSNLCQKKIWETDLFNSMKNLKNNSW